MAKIVKAVTTIHDITVTKDEEGTIYCPFNSQKFKDLANDFYGTHLWLTTIHGAFEYGRFCEKYFNMVKRKYFKK